MGDKKSKFKLNLLDEPKSSSLLSLIDVDRAISELRQGRSVAIRGANGKALIAQASEGLNPESFHKLTQVSGGTPALAITGRRAAVLGLNQSKGKIVTLTTDPPLTAETAIAIANPLVDLNLQQISISSRIAQFFDSENAAITLTKLARLLPSALTAPLNSHEPLDLGDWSLRHKIVLVNAGDIFQYERATTESLYIVSDARVPLAAAENTRVVAFRPHDGGIEHLAIIIGSPDPKDSVLTRIHSECFTGDILGSLRCDCGEQLRGAIAKISARGSGIILYLAQEGRGIGLVNKLRAYSLQDVGFDTVEANEQLGFDADERFFFPAARILQLLGYKRIDLMTNNPKKILGLEACGVQVVTRVAHEFASNKHNEKYLRTKAQRGDHLI